MSESWSAGEVPRPRRHPRRQHRPQIGHPVAGQRRNHKGVGEQAILVQRRRQRQQAVALDQVDLVERQNRLAVFGAESGHQPPTVVVHRAVRGIHQHHDQIGIPGALPRCRNHGAFKTNLWHKNSRRIDEDQLTGTGLGDAQHPAPGGLNLGADDGQLAADQGVQQRRLAGVGGADQGDKAAPSAFAIDVGAGQQGVVIRQGVHSTGYPNWRSKSRAAMVSARRRLRPVP